MRNVLRNFTSSLGTTQTEIVADKSTTRKIIRFFLVEDYKRPNKRITSVVRVSSTKKKQLFSVTEH